MQFSQKIRKFCQICSLKPLKSQGMFFSKIINQAVSEFKRINLFLTPVKLSENHRFPDDLMIKGGIEVNPVKFA